MDIKKILSWAVAIAIAFILVRVIFAILALTFKLFFIIGAIVFTLLFAIPIYQLIKHKFLKK